MKSPLHIPHRRSTWHNQDTVMHRVLNDPYVDWAMIIVIAALVTAAFVGLGFTTYFSTRDRLQATADKGTALPPTLFDTKAFDAVLSSFDTRAQERSAIIQGYTGVGDPSL